MEGRLGENSLDYRKSHHRFDNLLIISINKGFVEEIF
jgi:hypothetical protein